MSVPSWANYEGLKAPMCVVCCTQPPVPQDCSCALQIPMVPNSPNIDPFPDYATASHWLSDYAGDCTVFAFPNSNRNSTDENQDITTLTCNTAVSDQLTINETADEITAAPVIDIYASINLKSGSILSFTWDESDDGTQEDTFNVIFGLFNCSTGDQIDQVVFLGSPRIGSGAFAIIAEDGEYIISLTAGNQLFDNTTISCGFVLTCDDTMTINPVIALWDDSGTTRQLEACPVLTIPDPLSSVSAYADETEASAALDDYTSNCVGFSAFPAATFDTYSFVATDGGTSISLVFSGSLVFPGAIITPQNALYGSVNAEGGETISFDWAFTTSGNHGGPGGSVEFRVYDNEGVLVDSTTIFTSDGDSGTWVSAALPFSGRYTVFAQAVSNYVAIGSGDIADISLSLDVSSSGALTVNPIVALYANGDNCPSRLECNPLP